MKIFIAYGYTSQNQWIKDWIYPLVESFGAEVVHGEEVQGENISTAVIDKIKRSDGLIGFLTQVNQVVGQNHWTTRNWVLQELASARTAGRLFLEVRDREVDPNRGMLADTQPVYFSENEPKEKLLLELASVLCRWNKRLRKQRVCLIPENLARQIYRDRHNPVTSCSYRFKTGFNDTSPPKPVALERHVEAVCIHVDNFPEDEEVYIEISITTSSGFYVTGWQPINMLNLSLES